MAEPTPRDRSQPILRVPRDKTPGELILQDGERTYVLFFVPPGDSLARLFEETTAFVPVNVNGETRMVARAAIACVTANKAHVALDETELLQERQQVTIRLRGGHTVRAEMRWVAPYGHRRTLDHLNDAQRHIVAFDDSNIHFIAKSAIVSVEEG